VITGRGGGLRSVEMREALWLGFATMTLLTIMLLWARARSAWLRSRVDSLEERMLDAGLEL
jgi:hypothetical protein